MLILSFLIGLIGACMVSTGAWLYSPVAGLVCGGCFCLLWSFLAARSNSAGSVPNPKSGAE